MNTNINFKDRCSEVGASFSIPLGIDERLEPELELPKIQEERSLMHFRIARVAPQREEFIFKELSSKFLQLKMVFSSDFQNKELAFASIKKTIKELYMQNFRENHSKIILILYRGYSNMYAENLDFKKKNALGKIIEILKQKNINDEDVEKAIDILIDSGINPVAPIPKIWEYY